MIYNLLRALLYIPMRIVMLTNSEKNEFIKKRLKQDFNFLKSQNNYIWLHCSSVGEINLSDALIKKLLEERKEDILISVFTDTGYATGEKKYLNEDRIKIIYFPLDSKREIEKILSLINIKLLILIETEIWPNLIDLANKKGIRIALVNGRISDRSFKKYLKFKNFLKDILEKIDNFYMQTPLDKEKIIKIGADASKVSVVGNLKFDIELTNYTDEEKSKLKDIIVSDEREIFVAGSTRTGEDEIILEAFKSLENHLLVLVPRHLDRVEKIEKLISERGLSYSKFSNLENGDNKKSDVIIVDKMGVLRKFYSIADIAFVGGTLVNIGGHSLLEPLYYRKTPLFGKYLQNVKDIAKEILDREIGYEVLNSDEIVEVIKKIENSNEMATEIKSVEIDKFFMENQNVASKILKEINEKII